MSQPSPLRVHGDPDLDELGRIGLRPDELIDFSTNPNPDGPATAVRRALAEADPVHYPDAQGATVKQALAAHLGVMPRQVALGAGAAALLWDLPRVLLRPGARAVLEAPSFAELPAAAEATGAELTFLRGPGPADVPGVEALTRAARDAKAELVALSWPSSPAGTLRPAEDIEALAHALPATPIVVDEAFLSLSRGWEERERVFPDHVVRVRSLTKDHALAGVRVAYLLGAPDLVDALEAQRPPWSISSYALAAARATLDAEGHVAESRARLFAWRDELDGRLRSLGLRPEPSSTLYGIVDVRALGLGDAAELRAALLRRHGILVRDCASFGLPDHIRLCARPPAEQERLFDALTSLGSPA
ncbi:MAG: histidinol-phosphate transaminase [Myxococcota bacterium]